MFEISYSFCLSKIRVKFLYPGFLSEILNFRLLSRKIAYFQVRHVSWRYNWVMPGPIVLILLCMDRGFFGENLGKGLKQPPPPWLDVSQTIAWSEEG